MAGKTAATSEERKFRKRKAYLVGRLPGLKEESQTLRNERKVLQEKVKQAQGNSTELRSLMKRKAFIAGRLQTLKTERDELLSEQKALRTKIRAVSAERK
jgi:uncharacterized coiled-coil DUF342 family protein